MQDTQRASQGFHCRSCRPNMSLSTRVFFLHGLWNLTSFQSGSWPPALFCFFPDARIWLSISLRPSQCLLPSSSSLSWPCCWGPASVTPGCCRGPCRRRPPSLRWRSVSHSACLKKLGSLFFGNTYIWACFYPEKVKVCLLYSAHFANPI